RRFWDHGALDYPGIARAFFADISAGHVVQGGSTITQQLARNLYIKKPSQTFGRKATEACLAIKLAREKSKRWILNAYMNQVFYGSHAYGIEAASQTYFSKHARDLTLDESALLAGLPQAPTDYDPFHRPAQAIARRDEVLRALLANRDITSTQYAQAVADRRLHLKPGRVYTRIREPYFFSYVEAQLQKQYGSNTVRSGGLKVYTTIDPRLQRFANEAIKSTLYYSSDPAAAIVSINPSNGAIRAMTEVTPGNRESTPRRPAISRHRSRTTRPGPGRAASIRRPLGVRRRSTTRISGRRRSSAGHLPRTTPCTRGCRSMSARRTSRTWRGGSASRPTSRRPTERTSRRWGSGRVSSRRWTWRPSIRRSPAAGSTRSRWRSGR
ncbi:MAG: transglycosylase domain-containing protein, partial [Acidobacteria bacterium]|nr:transglycosylase domain-containing protein [Acidobacteriota bacterium]